MNQEEVERVLKQYFSAHLTTYDLALAHKFYDPLPAETEYSILNILIDVANGLGLRELQSEFFSEVLKVQEKYEE